MTKAILRPIARFATSSLRASFSQKKRAFSAGPRCSTDGVYSELTAMRTRTPFIEAFKRQQDQAKENVATSEAGVSEGEKIGEKKIERDLSPKTMADSYHRVVSSFVLC